MRQKLNKSQTLFRSHEHHALLYNKFQKPTEKFS